MTQESLQIATFGHAQPLEAARPGYSDNNAADEGTTQVATTPIPSQAGVGIPDLGQGSSSTDNGKKCACIVCLGIGTRDSSRRDTYHCRFNGCFRGSSYQSFHWSSQRLGHEKDHYQRGPYVPRRPFFCLVDSCGYTSKSWCDLIRHTTTKHCSNPTKFACSVIGCKYNGEGNGFTRKDKFMAHCKSMHQGQKVPGKAVRAIKPAPASSHAEASGSSSKSA